MPTISSSKKVLRHAKQPGPIGGHYAALDAKIWCKAYNFILKNNYFICFSNLVPCFYIPF